MRLQHHVCCQLNCQTFSSCIEYIWYQCMRIEGNLWKYYCHTIFYPKTQNVSTLTLPKWQHWFSNCPFIKRGWNVKWNRDTKRQIQLKKIVWTMQIARLIWIWTVQPLLREHKTGLNRSTIESLSKERQFYVCWKSPKEKFVLWVVMRQTWTASVLFTIDFQTHQRKWHFHL